MAKSINALASFITLLHGDRVSTIEAAREAFSSDFGHFARSNNREPLNQAAKALAKSAKDKALSEAITAGYKASGLAVGYIGAQSGKFASQPDNIREGFEAAIIMASEAFKASLEASKAFAEKIKASEAEKALAKAAKETKQAEAKEALIVALVQSGEIVRTVDVKKITDFGYLALLEALEAVTASDITALNSIVSHFQGLATVQQAAIDKAEAEAKQAEAKAAKALFNKASASKASRNSRAAQHTEAA